MIEVTVSNLQETHPVEEEAVMLFVAGVAEATGCDADEISVAFVGPERIREYNRTYRSIDRVTDVLSFGLDSGPGPDGRTNLGDLVVCTERASEQAATAGHPLWKELRILLLHGFLHLLGMDHPEDHSDPERCDMEVTEERLRNRLITD